MSGRRPHKPDPRQATLDTEGRVAVGLPKRICKGCLIPFIGERSGRLVAIGDDEHKTRRMKRAYILCRCDCGESRSITAYAFKNGRIKSCGCLRRTLTLGASGDRNRAWKGGKFAQSDGYVLVYTPDHPAATKAGYVFEHRLVMERIIGRPLLPKETVHHKNGIRSDNRPRNLELWASKHPAGQRVADLLDFAREIIAEYGDLRA